MPLNLSEMMKKVEQLKRTVDTLYSTLMEATERQGEQAPELNCNSNPPQQEGSDWLQEILEQEGIVGGGN